MKKIIFVLIALLICDIAFAAKPIIKKEIFFIRTGGCSTGYNSVYSNTSINQKDGIIEIVVHCYCEGCGVNTCTESSMVKISESTGLAAFSPAIISNINAMMEWVDNEIVANGVKVGMLSKKVLTNDPEKHLYQILLHWDNGQKNGDADISIQVIDLTKEVDI